METIFSAILRHAAAQPAAIAFEDPADRISYAMLVGGSETASAWLHDAGVRAGDTAALVFDLSPAGVTAGVPVTLLYVFYGLARLGAVVLPLYQDTPQAARRRAIESFGARWLVGEAPPADTPAVPLELSRLMRSPGGWQGRASPRGDGEERPFFYHFTSGTTGVPKACLFGAGQLAAWSCSAARPIGTCARDRIVTSRPWPEMVALRAMLRVHAAGATFVNALAPRTQEELQRLVGESGVTELSLSPFQLRTLLHSPAPAVRAEGGLRVLTVGGGLVYPEEILQARAALTPNFYVDYGCNEIGRIAVLGPGDPVDVPGGVGRLTPGVEAQVVDGEDRPLPPGESGILRFRTPWMPQGYAGNPQATAERFRNGWVYPGDAGSIDERGYVRVAGRTDDVINFGGLKITPSEVEAVLRLHPDVRDCAVAGVPDPLSGESPVAFVVARGSEAMKDPTETLHRFCAQRMDGSRAPRRFVFVPEIPHSEDGKVQRARLREMYFAMQPPQPAQG